MSFWSNPLRTIRRVVTHPARSVGKLIRNPADMILGNNIRDTSLYRNVARPVIKVGVATALGAATGGLSLGAGGIAFTGLSAIGAGVGALTSAATGGLTSKGFQPLKDVVAPAVTGFVAGQVKNAFNKAAIGAPVAAPATAAADTVTAVSTLDTASKVVGVVGTGAGVAATTVSALGAIKQQKAQDALSSAEISAMQVAASGSQTGAGNNAPQETGQGKPVDWGKVGVGAAAGFSVGHAPGAAVGAVVGAVT